MRCESSTRESESRLSRPLASGIVSKFISRTGPPGVLAYLSGRQGGYMGLAIYQSIRFCPNIEEHVELKASHRVADLQLSRYCCTLY
jgi:hypothetical protein